MHLHIICTSEDTFGLTLVVPLCSLEAKTADRACLLHMGDHPFIKHPSFIHYAKSEILEVSSLQEALKRGDIIPQDDCDAQVFQLVLDGLALSTALRPKKSAYFKRTLEPLSAAA